jgi:CPA2 family monovalent cation:H+ antiporter-2
MICVLAAVHNEVPLIATIAVGLAFAFVGGLLAVKLRLPPLVGYLLAGIVVGPFTPGFVADTKLAPQLAEIGVILLMFGVGTHFSVRDLFAVRRFALPGALAQIAVATALGAGVAHLWGWSLGAGIIFDCRCRLRAPWCCSVRLRRGIWSAPTMAGSRSVGWWWRIW